MSLSVRKCHPRVLPGQQAERCTEGCPAVRRGRPLRAAMSGRTTRRRALAQKEASASLATAVMSCSDICRLLLPTLPFGAFVSLRCSCAGIYRATQAVCEELVAILERAALLYVSPHFSEALTLVSEWLYVEEKTKAWPAGI